MVEYREFRRPRLEALLDSAGQYPLAVVQAPAGFGKSVLLNQWRDSRDRDGRRITFLGGSAVVGSEKTKGDRRKLIEALRRALQNRSDEVIILDNADELFLDEESSRWLIDAVDDRARKLTVILGARKRLAVPISKLRMQGKVLELGPDDLRFTPKEVSGYFDGLLPGEAESITSNTGGWAVAVQGLKMTRLKLGTNDHLSGREKWLSDYFREEVLRGQSTRVLEFVRRASIFRRFSAVLCDYCFENTGNAALIREIEDAGILVQPMSKDRKWFAFEPLFFGFLQYLLEEEPLPNADNFRSRAAKWFEKNGLIEEAFEHTLCFDTNEAAALIDRNAIFLSRTGRMRLVISLAERLPKSVISAFPTLLLTMAQFSSIAWRTPEAQELLKIVDERNSHHAHEDNRVQFMIRDQRMQVAFYEDDMPRAETLCKELLRDPSGADDAFIGHVYGSLIYAQREQFKFSESSRFTEIARRHFDRANEFYALIWHHTKVAPGLLLMGDLPAAFEEAKQGYEFALRYTRQYPHLASAPALLLAMMRYERNETEEAARLIDEYLTQSRGGFIDQLSAGYVTRSKIFQLQNKHEMAFDLLSKGLTVASERGLDRLKQYLLEEQFRLLLVTGEIAKLKRMAGSEGMSLVWTDYFPSVTSTTRDERRALAWVHAYSLSEPGGAIALTKRWREKLSRSGALGARLSWDLVLCKLFLAQGEENDAIKMLRTALDVASAGRFVRRILDEESAIKQLIVSQTTSSGIAPTSTDRFAEELVQLMSNRAPQLLLPKATSDNDATAKRTFSQKEVDILFMAGSGLSNREIARKFGLTEGSVKWYLQQIYNKIGTRRRAALIGRARLLGLMPRE